MAPEGVDIGILMGSRSPQVLMEAVKAYPGAMILWDAVETGPCDCTDPLCSQNAFQRFLDFDNVELSTKILAEVLDKKPTTYMQLKELHHDFYHREVAEKQNSVEKAESILEQLLGRSFKGRVIPMVAGEGVGSFVALDDLGDDEPEHGGPPEE